MLTVIATIGEAIRYRNTSEHYLSLRWLKDHQGIMTKFSTYPPVKDQSWKAVPFVGLSLA